MTARSAGPPIVIAEDDADILAAVRDAIRSDELQVATARTASAAIEAIHFHRPSVVVVDVAMDGRRGWDVLRASTRRAGMSALALDRSSDALARRAALACGADDVVGAPFDAEEIAARVRALVQRQLPDARGGPVYRHRDLVLDVAAHEVRVGGRVVGLTPQQFAILAALCESAGATLHRSQLIARIAAVDDEPPSDRAVDLHVSRLRRRLGDGRPARYVDAVYGIGYRLAPAHDEAGPLADATAVLEALPEAVLVLDSRLEIRAVNRSAEVFLGRQRGDLVGRGCDEVLACRTCGAGPLAGPSCLGKAVLAGGSGVRHARALVRAADGPVEVRFSHVPVAAADGTRAVAISIHPTHA